MPDSKSIAQEPNSILSDSTPLGKIPVRALMDGNEATARIAHKLNEVIAIYPITPSSTMAELADAWSSKGQKNIWGMVPRVVEMQSEGGAAGTVHGALQAGALCTTFTASQGLLLMLPNMVKIAGELTPTVFHVSARSLAAQGLSIFGDHGDIMAARWTGFAMLGSNSVQEAQDMAAVAYAATLESRIPFMHFFDGFRTSHEINSLDLLDDDDLKALIDDDLVKAHRARALTPDHPQMRGTAQNPDVYFQGRETVNSYYNALPTIVERHLHRLAELTGRKYGLVDYTGAPNAERVIVIMGSGAQTVEESVKELCRRDEKVGVLTIRLYRPFPVEQLLAHIPNSVKKIAVLDRSKEPGAAGEALFKDVASAYAQALAEGQISPENFPKIVGGRYGLSSKEFTPSMVKSIFDELKKDIPRKEFTVGIIDDITHLSLAPDLEFNLERKFYEAVFVGLGSDGTVGANKNTIKIVSESTGQNGQAYFVYDSKKSGSMTTSHLRFGKNGYPKEEIKAPWLISQADFLAVHHAPFLNAVELVQMLAPKGILLVNSEQKGEQLWDSLPRLVQEQILEKEIRLYSINAYEVAKNAGMGRRINTVMQVCFFKLAQVMPVDLAIQKIKDAIQKTYAKKGESVVAKNWNAVDSALESLVLVPIPQRVTSEFPIGVSISKNAPDFVKKVTAELIAGRGDFLPVSAIPADGTWPTGTTQYEKRNLALELPVWHNDLCIQCGKCSFVCPHAAIRSRVYGETNLEGAPSEFKSTAFKGKTFGEGAKYTIQVSPDDCTGCTLCVDACPSFDRKDPSRKALLMEAQKPLREKELQNWDFFQKLPPVDPKLLKLNLIKDNQLIDPLFEFSGACSGCGETPYLKLMSQLYGDRMLVANATGCSSIYGGNLPTTPWSQNHQGRGPAWANSLFEDNAEFGLGFRLAADHHFAHALALLAEQNVSEELYLTLRDNPQSNASEIELQREKVNELKEILSKSPSKKAQKLLDLADYLVKKSIWIVGGDGWAYDIGYGGLDHVLASGENVNILVLDTESYSNTGGQASKATPKGAVAHFASSGKSVGKKDLAMLAMHYGNVYVARVAMGASDAQTVRAFLEAEAHPGPSLIIAYSPCISHGYAMGDMLKHQDQAVKTGYWPLLRYNPAWVAEGKPGLKLDSRPPTEGLQEMLNSENRFTQLARSNPELAQELAVSLGSDIQLRWDLYEALATPKSENT